jgi:hypothetical protein
VKTNLMLATLMTASLAMAQLAVPDGTKIRVRLEENISSETADLGQTVDFVVAHEVRMGDTLLVAYGAPATGTVVEVEHKRRMGRAGKLDFSIDRIQMVDGNWMSVRYTPQKVHGKGSGVKTGVITAGIAMVFWPAAPLGLLVKGHEAVATKGRSYDVFADTGSLPVTLAGNSALSAPAAQQLMATPAPAPVMTPVAASAPVADNGGLPIGAPAANTSAPAMVSINANTSGADIEVDGNFVGSTPTTIQITAGMHQITVRQGSSQWQRNIQITGGTISVTATLGGPALQTASR